MLIEKDTHVYKKTITRILEIDEEAKQVNFLDSRFYKRNNLYYPSITSVLQYFPKGKFFEDWIKQVGSNAEHIAYKSAKEGTHTHDAIERYLKGEEILWVNEYGNANYSLEVWKMILRFVDFWETYKPKLIHSEIHLFSDVHKIAGTCDLVLEINGKIWLLDIKTSNNLHTSYDLQTAAYAVCWNETFEEKIENTGIIWLKSSKRGPDKNQKIMCGKGWEIYESPRSIQENWNFFSSILDIYRMENKNNKPAFESFPTSVKLKS